MAAMVTVVVVAVVVAVVVHHTMYGTYHTAPHRATTQLCNAILANTSTVYIMQRQTTWVHEFVRHFLEFEVCVHLLVVAGCQWWGTLFLPRPCCTLR